ncbi:MAG: putative toxin-antitoxin system toxin component, PIN family [Bacteroidales bacterium]|nr:putative toxin-antitoxin system toxin component, PIN family [Bacteroidales bacterium]
MIYAVFDTNVLVSALITHNAESSTVLIVKAIAENRIIPIYNKEILMEYIEVLHREKFNIAETDISLLINLILQTGISSHRIACDEKFSDPDDAVFYEIALSKKNAYLITGKVKHYPRVPIVVTPAEMLQILQEKQTL